ncbi:MAG TPA: hypothetical protein VK464_00680 [Symbiobacteriaceae bacterium]|nr:hypothetical protein [Symbiobacteriaceae bacterium]
MPVVPATVEALVPDSLVVSWGKNAPLGDVEGFLTYLLDADGLGQAVEAPAGPSIEVDLDDTYCVLSPAPDLWSMIITEELAVRLARCQGGNVADGRGRALAFADAEDSQPWGALESVGVMSLFRPRPPEVPDMNSHPLIPLEDCKISGVHFNEEQEAVLDLYFDYWARPCAFLTEEGQEDVLLYRPMYRFRQAIFGASDLCKVQIKGPPQSRIYGALGVRGYKVAQHRVDRRNIWSIKGQGQEFSFRCQTEEAWLTRSVPLWYQCDPLLLGTPTDRDFEVNELLRRKEQHWDIVDAIYSQEWYVAAHADGTLNPFGRIYSADPTAALLDLPGLKPKSV